MKLRKIIHIYNKNTGTIKTLFLVGKFNYFTHSYDYFFRTVQNIRMPNGEYRRFASEVMV